SNTASDWMNAGGQLIRRSEIERLISQIKDGSINTWTEVHAFYIEQGRNYAADKLAHSLWALEAVYGISIKNLPAAAFRDMLQRALHTREWMMAGIAESRAKDYENPFRLMTYSSREEMNKVIGSLESNSFIKLETENLERFRTEIAKVVDRFKL
ncbi:MAG TPA: DUF4954 domain-containing protein, partial [Chitinophagaceae bacterium]|nr:DUF4954 domain-containing protein [Chitinophagaceae bacterium]